MTIKHMQTSRFSTLPCVIFYRRNVETGEPLTDEPHVLIFELACDARQEAESIKSNPHLQLVGTADGLCSKA